MLRTALIAAVSLLSGAALGGDGSAVVGGDHPAPLRAEGAGTAAIECP